MPAETVNVVVASDGVNETPSGWFEVELDTEEGERIKASTKDKEVADAALEIMGEPTTAKISRVVKGRFTNIYLNEINGTAGAKPKRSAASVSDGGSGGYSPPSGKSTETQERIARQWAYGRAVELLVGSGMSYNFPLVGEMADAVDAQAKALLDKTK